MTTETLPTQAAIDTERTASDRSALVLFSGGQDSTACLAWALRRYDRVETVGFDYGQRHVVEMQARQSVLSGILDVMPDVAPRLGLDHLVDLRGFGAVAESALTRDREIDMTVRGLPSSFVPGRNLVFFVYAAALADRRGIDVLVGGMCETDFSGYPDCRRDTLDATQTMLRLGIGRPYKIETPLMFIDKADTWALTHGLGGQALTDLILEQTHTCYLGERGARHDWGYGCGHCPACELRARGFQRWRDAQA